jgi:phosphate transport system substrate-binding protein
MEKIQSPNLAPLLGGRYQIVQQFGAGGFSQTFLADDLHLPNRPRCVIKQLKPNFETHEEWETARRLFNTEAQVLYMLGSHDQIPRLLAHFEEDQKFYLAQELIVGEPLDQVLVNKLVWTQAEVVTLLKDLLGVLAFVHDKGVIHRDIKPSNLIRRQQDGRIVLIDFGAVKQVSLGAAEAKSRKTDLTVSIGTQGYTSNEQLAGEPCFSSDIYAVGMVAIRIITGVHPKSLRKDPRTHEFRWQQEGIYVCPELAAVLDRMVRYSFRERYSTAQEALEALESISAHIPGLSLEPPTILDASNVFSKSLQSMAEMDSAEALDDYSLEASFMPKRSPNIIPGDLIPTQLQTSARVLGKRLVSLGGLVGAMSCAILIANSLLSSQTDVLWLNQHSDQVPVSPPSQAQEDSMSASDTRGDLSQAELSASLSNFREASNVPTGLFKYGGSTTWAVIRDQVDPALQTAQSEFNLHYMYPVDGTPGSGTGIRMLLEGQLDFAQSSRPLQAEEYQQAQLQGFRLKQIPVAIDGIAIAVHPSLSVPGLNLKQLQGIYTGKITNWKEVGGPDRAITPYSRRPVDSGTADFFIKNVLADNPLEGHVQYVYDTMDGLREMATNPGGIYYDSAPLLISQCGIKTLPIARGASNFIPPYQEASVSPGDCPQQNNQLNVNAFKTGEYPITRLLFVIVKQDDHLDQQAGEAYANLLLTNEGQELISKAGFVRIR